MNERHLGSSLDDFLMEEGQLTEAEAVAAKRVLAFQISQLMAEQQLSKAKMARRMSTSRVAVDRLLDYNTESATLVTLEKAAAVRRAQIAHRFSVSGGGQAARLAVVGSGSRCGSRGPERGLTPRPPDACGGGIVGREMNPDRRRR